MGHSQENPFLARRPYSRHSKYAPHLVLSCTAKGHSLVCYVSYVAQAPRCLFLDCLSTSSSLSVCCCVSFPPVDFSVGRCTCFSERRLALSLPLKCACIPECVLGQAGRSRSIHCRLSFLSLHTPAGCRHREVERFANRRSLVTE